MRKLTSATAAQGKIVSAPRREEGPARSTSTAKADGYARGASGQAKPKKADTRSATGLGRYVGNALSQFPKAVGAVMIGAALVGAPAIARADPPQSTEVRTEAPAEHNTTVTRPLTFELGVGFPDGAHLGVNYNFNRYFSIGGNAGSAYVFHDFGLNARLYPFDTENWHPYLEGSGHLMLLPTSDGLNPTFIPQGRLGLEYRGSGGFTFGIDGGVGVPVNTKDHLPIPVFGITLGYSL